MCGVFGVGGAACVRAAEHEVTVPSLCMHEFGVKTSYWHSLQKQRDSNGCGKKLLERSPRNHFVAKVAKGPWNQPQHRRQVNRPVQKCHDTGSAHIHTLQYRNQCAEALVVVCGAWDKPHDGSRVCIHVAVLH